LTFILALTALPFMQQCSSVDAAGRHAERGSASGDSLGNAFRSLRRPPNAISWPGPGELPEGDIYEITTQALGALARRSPGHDLLTEFVTQSAG